MDSILLSWSPSLRATAAALLLAAGSLFSAGCNNSEPVAGRFDMNILIGPPCPSPVGLCASGTTIGGIDGEIQVLIMTAENETDDLGRPITRVSAKVTLVANKGDLYGTMTGRVLQQNGEVHSVVTLSGGTAYYRGAGGTLEVWGKADLATGVETDFYSGILTWQ